MREIGSSELRLEDILRVVHKHTQVLEIYVVIDNWSFTETDHMRDFLLTENAFVRSTDGEEYPEMERLLKYYADLPVWNLTAGLKQDYLSVRATLQVHCDYSDLRDAYLQEKADIKREKRRAYLERRKQRRREERAREQQD